MNPATSTISRFNRDMAIGTAVRWLLGAAGLACVLVGSIAGTQFNGGVLLVLIAAVYLVLGYRSVRGSQMAALSPVLIASGHFDQAEQQIDRALRSFSIFRGAKLLSLHHLAVLRHAQRSWQETAILCRALLNHRLGPMQSLAKPSRLLLADSLLQLNETSGAYDALGALYTQRLTLAEATGLLSLQLDYAWRVNAWDAMLAGIKSKVQLAELMPASAGARSQALLALAARKLGKIDLADWLANRARLLVDAEQLVAERPVLEEIVGSRQ